MVLRGFLIYIKIKQYLKNACKIIFSDKKTKKLQSKILLQLWQ